MKAILVPASWIFVCFLRGDYYVCAFFPDPIKNQTMAMPCEMHKVSDRESLLENRFSIRWSEFQSGRFLKWTVIFDVLRPFSLSPQDRPLDFGTGQFERF